MKVLTHKQGGEIVHVRLLRGGSVRDCTCGWCQVGRNAARWGTGRHGDSAMPLTTFRGVYTLLHATNAVISVICHLCLAVVGATAKDGDEDRVKHKPGPQGAISHCTHLDCNDGVNDNRCGCRKRESEAVLVAEGRPNALANAAGPPRTDGALWGEAGGRGLSVAFCRPLIARVMESHRGRNP